MLCEQISILAIKTTEKNIIQNYYSVTNISHPCTDKP